MSDEPVDLERAAIRKQVLEEMFAPLPPIEGDTVTITREALRRVVAYCKSLEDEDDEDWLPNEALMFLESWLRFLDFRKPAPGTLGTLYATEYLWSRSVGPGRGSLDAYITSRDPVKVEIRHRERKKRGKNKDNVTALPRNQADE